VTIAAQAAIAIENARLYARSDQALARRVRELDSILRTVQEGIMLFDQDYRVLAANRALAHFLSTAQLELQGHSLPESFSEEGPSILSLLCYSPSDLQTDCQALAEGAVDVIKQEIVLPPPLETHLERTLVPVHNGQGEISGWLLVLRDLTEERELARLREEMTSMLVHDLRSPLTVLVSGLELIRMELDEGNIPALDEVLGLAEQSTNHVLGMVNDLLDTSRLESGQMSLSPQPLEVKPFLEKVVARLAPLAEAAHITLEVTAEPGLPALVADPYIIDRVVHNLVDNAIKFTPDEGQIYVWAQLDEAAPPATMLVGVTDTGPGIPTSAQPRLFAKFQQVNPDAGRRRGTGLGLPFCKLAVEAHGGQIWVESQVGKGSTFVMRLPVAGAQA
jgi:NtrC-family two-component system sensor histidine kinase KinB